LNNACRVCTNIFEHCGSQCHLSLRSYCATCDGAFFRDSEVVVVGENHEAMEEAMFLTKYASTVHWITKHDMSGDAIAKDLLAQPNIVQHSPARLMSIEGDASGVTGIKMKLKNSEHVEDLSVEGVFLYVAGSKPITDFIGEQIDLKEDGGVIVDDEMRTSVPGVYAIGDIRNTPYKQVVVAASDGCIAAIGIDRFLTGRKKTRLDWIHTPPPLEVHTTAHLSNGEILMESTGEIPHI
jgi:thioredoxin reductase (NADPH)